MSAPGVAAVLAEPVDGRFRALPPLPPGTTVGSLGTAGLRLGDLVPPFVAVRDAAVAHNVATMQAWCAEHGVDLAPHGKTTMAPQLFARQLDAGAWGMTAANAYQATVMHAAGARRVIIANEVVGRGDVARLVATTAADPAFTPSVCADSPAAVAALAEGVRAAGATAPLRVLVELGAAGGRAGARGLDAALAVGRAVAAADGLQLAGVETYEGALGGDREPATLAAVDRLLDELAALAAALDAEGRFDGAGEILLTAGGSTFFDRVAARLAGPHAFSLPCRVVVRSGSSVVHDDGMYARTSPLRDRLRPALELWAEVLSRPEPGLAILGFGKRDAPYDLDLPFPRAVVGADGIRRDLARARIDAVNDQHAFLRWDPDGGAGEPAVGERVQLGVSHPCTTFDKWSLLPLLGPDDAVVGAIRTLF